MVVVDDASVEKMSGSDVDVEPYLNSRNTVGHGTATQISKQNMTKLSELVVVIDGGVCGIWRCYAEVVVVCRSVCGHQNKICRNMDGKRAVERK